MFPLGHNVPSLLHVSTAALQLPQTCVHTLILFKGTDTWGNEPGHQTDSVERAVKTPRHRIRNQLVGAVNIWLGNNCECGSYKIRCKIKQRSQQYSKTNTKGTKRQVGSSLAFSSRTSWIKWQRTKTAPGYLPLVEIIRWFDRCFLQVKTYFLLFRISLELRTIPLWISNNRQLRGV